MTLIAEILRNLGISAIGAFIAYLLWDFYQSPMLVATEMSQWKVYYPNADPAYFLRMTVENIGQIAAHNCRAQLWLRGENPETGNLYFAYMPLPWGNKRTTLIANAEEDYTSTRIIGKGESVNLDVLLMSHTDSVRLPHPSRTGEMLFIEIDPENFNGEDVTQIGKNILLNDVEDSDNPKFYRPIKGMQIEEWQEIDWTESEVHIETSNGNTPTIEINLTTSDGKIDGAVNHPDTIRQAKNLIRRVT